MSNESARPRRPIRTCAVCRAQAPKELLERLAAQDGELVADPKRTVSGRGVYVHPEHDITESKTKSTLIRSVSRRRG
jgi:hypothetical protein